MTVRARNPTENAALADLKVALPQLTKHDHAHHAKHAQNKNTHIQQ